MTREEELPMLRHVRGLYNYRVRGPKILLGLGLGAFASAVGMPILIGVLAGISSLLHRFIQ